MIQSDREQDLLDDAIRQNRVVARLNPISRAGDILPWLGGGRADTLRFCPTERSLYAGLGLGVLMTALFGGASATLAAGFVLGGPAASYWPIGAFWGLVLANMDRLLLLVTASRNRLLAMIPRLAISLLLGFLMAAPLTDQVFGPEINAQMATTQQQSQKTQLADVEQTYQPKIGTDNDKIAGLNHQLQVMQDNINRAKFLASCEAGETNCSTTHQLGCGPYCQRYRNEAAADAAHYAEVAPGLRQQISHLRSDADGLAAQESLAEQRIHTAIADSGGWAARTRALGQIERQDSGIRTTVWLVRLAFILVDLAPLIIKFLLVIFGKSVYEQITEAQRDYERSEACRFSERAWLNRRKIARRAGADDEIDQAMVDAYKEQRIAATGSDAGWESHGPHGHEADEPIEALTLSTFAEGMKSHENMPVPIARALTLLAWIGTAILAGLTAIILGAAASHISIAAGWLPLIAFPVALALALYTRAFRSGPAWAQRAVFGSALLAPALLVLIIAVNW